MSPGGLETVTLRSIVQRGTTEPTTTAAEAASNLCYVFNNLINVYLAIPDPNPRGEGQLLDPNECNSTLTSATREEMLISHPNECNSTLTSGTRGIYPHSCI